MVESIISGKAWWQDWEAAGHMGPQPGVRSDGCLYYTAHVLHSVQSTLQSMGGAATFRTGLPCSVKHLHRPTQNCISAMILNIIKLSVNINQHNNTPYQCDMPTHGYLCFSLLFVFVCECVCVHLYVWYTNVCVCVCTCMHMRLTEPDPASSWDTFCFYLSYVWITGAGCGTQCEGYSWLSTWLHLERTMQKLRHPMRGF